MSKRSSTTLRPARTKMPRIDRVQPSGDSKFLDLPLELRHLIYAELIYPGLPGSRSALTVTSKQLRNEVHDWLAHQKLTIHVQAWQDEWYTAPPWYESVLQRATNIEFDLSCLPAYPSHPMVDLLCWLWRDECSLKRVSCTVLDESVPARECRYPDDGSNFPDTLPSSSKELLCKWLLYPVRLVLAKRGLEPTYTSMIWTQSHPKPMVQTHLEGHFQNLEAGAILFRTFTKQTILQPDERIWTPLVHAVRKGHQAVVEVLSESATVDWKKETISEKTLLIEAALNAQVSIIDVLLQRLCSRQIVEILDLQDLSGKTALSHVASLHPLASLYQQATLQYLLEKHADPDLKDSQGMTPLLHAVCRAQMKVVKTLCNSSRVNKAATDDIGRTVLHFAAKTGESGLFEFLLQESGVDVNAADFGGKTALFYAAEDERAALVKRLLNLHGASVNVRDKSGRTPLSHAVQHGSYRSTDLLLRAGAECVLEDEFGKTPLFYAVSAGHCSTTVRLVDHMKNGNDALMLAGQMRQTKIEEKLLDMSRAVTDWEEGRLHALLLRSARDGRDSIVRQILHLHEVKADIQDHHGRTPLSYAAEKGHRNIFKILSRNGADRNLEDKQGRSPKDYAQGHGQKMYGCIREDWASKAESYRRKEPRSH